MRRFIASPSVLLAAFLLLCSLTALSADAQVKLGSPFGEHMVLPSGVPVEIWGEGCPGGDTLKLAIAGQSVATRSDWQGRWLVKLAPMKPGGPYQMNIQIGGSGRLVVSSAANDHGGAEINDVMIGRLIVLQATALPESKPTSGPQSMHPFARVRVYRPESGGSKAQWVYVSQAGPPSGTEAYFRAGQELEQQLRIPVGVMIQAPQPTSPIHKSP